MNRKELLAHIKSLADKYCSECDEKGVTYFVLSGDPSKDLLAWVYRDYLVDLIQQKGYAVNIIPPNPLSNRNAHDSVRYEVRHIIN